MGKENEIDSKTAYVLSDINYHAGNKALDSLATEAANEYFKFAAEISCRMTAGVKGTTSVLSRYSRKRPRPS